MEAKGSRAKSVAIVVLLVALVATVVYAGRLHWQTRFLRAENVRLQSKLERFEERAPAAAVRSERVLSDGERQAMLDELSRASAATKEVWFVRTAGDRETAAYQRALQSVFEEADWTVRASTTATFPLRPGIFFFMADEMPPAYVETALAAFGAAGIDVASGRGYRAFYEEKTRENPNWRGFKLAEDQAYIIAIGPKPADE